MACYFSFTAFEERQALVSDKRVNRKNSFNANKNKNDSYLF
ncbi:hypothetical protein imdm_1492 [gamma proteobacterium IMCC2047]|nr:hypothetical protein imdm_1492 [gamma proteobacterium IMCC2047]